MPVRAFFAVAFGVLVIVFWILQVLQNAKYEGLADNNYLRTIPLRAPRGVLFDRNGRVLVENRHSFTIAVLREATSNLERDHSEDCSGDRRAPKAPSARPSTGAVESRSSGRFRSSSMRRSSRSPRSRCAVASCRRSSSSRFRRATIRPIGSPRICSGTWERFRRPSCRRSEFSELATGRDHRPGRTRAYLQSRPPGCGRRPLRRREQPRT